ncbi:hypothetical protein Tco_1174243, partial [Tanacetum coccineum]
MNTTCLRSVRFQLPFFSLLSNLSLPLNILIFEIPVLMTPPCYIRFTSKPFSFFLKESAGVLHLKKLSDVDLKHIHLLPTFQFGDVEDEKEKWKFVGKRSDMEMLESLPPDSVKQQEYITTIFIRNEHGNKSQVNIK